MSTPRRDAGWAPGCCRRCRGRERRAAFKARRRRPDPTGVELARALLALRSFDIEHAVPIARHFGRPRAALVDLLGELVVDGFLSEARAPDGRRSFAPCAEDSAGEGAARSAGGVACSSLPVGDEGDASASTLKGDASTFSGDASDPGGDAYDYERGGLPSTSDIERIAALNRVDPAKHAEEVDKMLAFLTDRARGARCPTAPGRILDTGGWSRRGPEALRPGPVVAVAVLDRIFPVLNAARTTGARLLRVSLRVPTWGDALRGAADEFLTRLDAAGAAGAMLSLDVSETGEPHLYGFVLSDDRKGVIAEWLRCSGATRGATDVRAVTGWKAFASSGDPDACAHGRSLRSNLTRAMHYAFKDFPAGYGSRDLSADVLATGVFEPLWMEVRPVSLLNPSSIRGAAFVGDHWWRHDSARL